MAHPQPLVVSKPAAMIFDLENTLLMRDFPARVQYPYVAEQAIDYAEQHILDLELIEMVDEMHQEQQCQAFSGAPEIKIGNSAPAFVTSIAAYVGWCLDHMPYRDSPGLQKFRNCVLRAGLERHDPKLAHAWVYRDVAIRFKAWHRAGIKLYIFSSSGISKYTAKCTLADSIRGDLDQYVERYFDVDADGLPFASLTYKRLMTDDEKGSAKAKLPFKPDEIIVVSQCHEKVTAAKEAGLGAILVCSHLSDYKTLGSTLKQRLPVIRSFYELQFLDQDVPLASALDGAVNCRFGLKTDDDEKNKEAEKSTSASSVYKIKYINK